ncbi:MAG: hypothetical protein WBZ36_22440 [Candidatus Nitrosopolaris sp.]|jgi:uncharacterized protein YoaH (UPF0181 family)
MRTRFLRAIIAEREKRHQEILLINKEKELIAYERRNLQLEKKQLEYDRRSLEARLAEVEKYRDILPSAQQLRDEMGVDFHEIVIWIEVIRNKSATEGITPKEAVSLIVKDLRSYNQLNSLQKSVTHAQQNLEALNIVIEQRQRAIASLVDFQSKGISDTELIELNKLINSWGGWSQEQNNNGVNTVKRLARLDDKLHIPIN